MKKDKPLLELWQAQTLRGTTSGTVPNYPFILLHFKCTDRSTGTKNIFNIGCFLLMIKLKTRLHVCLGVLRR